MTSAAAESFACEHTGKLDLNYTSSFLPLSFFLIFFPFFLLFYAEQNRLDLRLPHG